MAKFLNGAKQLITSSKFYQAGVHYTDWMMKPPMREQKNGIAKALRETVAFLVAPAGALAFGATAIAGAIQLPYLIAATALAPLAPPIGITIAVAAMFTLIVPIGFGAVALFSAGVSERAFKTIADAFSNGKNKQEMTQIAAPQADQPASTLGQKEVSSTFGASAANVATQEKTTAPAKADTPTAPK